MRDKMFCFIILTLVATCTARQSQVFEEKSAFAAAPSSVITVPTNCPAGQQLISGQCRDVWKVSVVDEPILGVTAAPLNVITVPVNCPPGQELINGQCRDIWRIPSAEEATLGVTAAPLNVITVPINCLPGQELINGQCRDIWRMLPDDPSLGVTPAPLNVITVPTNCPPGQQLINGECRDIWVKNNAEFSLTANINKALKDLFASENGRAVGSESIKEDNKEEFSVKNVISVPYQCPAGYAPDSLGVCREIWQ